MRKVDFLFFLGFIFILLVGIFLIQYYFNYKNNSCQNNPFVFASKGIEDQYDAKFYGVGYLVGEKGRIFTLNFNSTSSSWFNP